MDSIYDTVTRLVGEGQTVAVATIIAVRGSVPREVGAKMVVHPLGQHVGTVGGGCGEAEVIRAGLDVILTGQPAIVRSDLTEDISMRSLGVCGGILDVFVEQASPAPGPGVLSAQERSAALQQATQARQPVAVVTVVEGPQAGRAAVIWLERPPLGSLGLGDLETRAFEEAQTVLRGRQHKLLRYPDAGTAVFVEVQRRSPELLIVGAGHIAVPLAQIAGLCDFAVTVLDDRPLYASPQRFPTAQRVLAAPLRETVRDLALDQDSFVVLVTRGHSHDVECLLELLDRPVGYIGMIGSKRRVEAVFRLLEEEMGLDPALFDRVYAPIGLDIGAQTPAEIAVCITAEMVNVYRRGGAPSLSDGRRQREQARRGRAAPPAGAQDDR